MYESHLINKFTN